MLEHECPNVLEFDKSDGRRERCFVPALGCVLAAISLVVALLACEDQGAVPTSDQVRNIAIGHTRADLVTILGTPTRETSLENQGRELVWDFDLTPYYWKEEDSLLCRLIFVVDERGVVRDADLTGCPNEETGTQAARSVSQAK